MDKYILTIDEKEILVAFINGSPPKEIAAIWECEVVVIIETLKSAIKKINRMAKIL